MNDKVEEERRLAEQRRTKDLPFDIQPVTSASIDDLDIEFFEHHYLKNAIAPDILEKNKRTIEDQLKALRFITYNLIPTVLGILVAGKMPRNYLPGAYIQFLHINGTKLTDPIQNQKEITGPLSHILDRLDVIIDSHNNVSASITSGPKEVRAIDYPVETLLQICRNAVLHRTYEGTSAPVRVYWYVDRVEIYSPGGTYGQVTEDNFGQPGITDYRNSVSAYLTPPL
jgi:ATP-dependent DNA helicase RecG